MCVHRPVHTYTLYAACRNGKEPTLTLRDNHKYHLFLSHIWGSGQDQAAVIKRCIQLLLPSAVVFLDVDDLEEIGKLEWYIDASACVMIFLSKGYFLSRNCLREARQTVEKQIPIVLVHEADVTKGGLTLDQSKAECSDELRSGVFMRHARGAEGGPTGLVPREVIAWLRVREFQLLSLRMICHELLLASPLYSITGKGSTHQLSSLAGMYVSGELLSLGLSCEHQNEPSPLAISSHNPGAWAVGKEVVRAVPGVTLVRDASEAHDAEGNPLTVKSRVLHKV